MRAKLVRGLSEDIYDLIWPHGCCCGRNLLINNVHEYTVFGMYTVYRCDKLEWPTVNDTANLACKAAWVGR